MKEKVIVANPYNDDHISMLEEYENNNGISHTTSDYLKNIKNMLSEVDYRQLEQERPEVVTTLLLIRKNEILTMAHLIGEKDRRVCRITVDSTAQPRQQEKLLDESEKYAFGTLGMEDIIYMQEAGNHIPSQYFLNRGYDDLGIEDDMHIYSLSKTAEKTSSHTI